MPFEKVFGALKDMTGYDVHGMVKEGALKNPGIYNLVEQGVGLAKKIPGLSAATFGISDYLLNSAGDYMKKTREEVQNIQNPEAKEVLQSELKQVQQQPQQQPQQSIPQQQPYYFPPQQLPNYSAPYSRKHAVKGVRARMRENYRNRNKPR